MLQLCVEGLCIPSVTHVLAAHLWRAEMCEGFHGTELRTQQVHS
jgi:hypothetical protein